MLCNICFGPCLFAQRAEDVFCLLLAERHSSPKVYLQDSCHRTLVESAPKCCSSSLSFHCREYWLLREAKRALPVTSQLLDWGWKTDVSRGARGIQHGPMALYQLAWHLWPLPWSGLSNRSAPPPLHQYHVCLFPPICPTKWPLWSLLLLSLALHCVLWLSDFPRPRLLQMDGRPLVSLPLWAGLPPLFPMRANEPAGQHPAPRPHSALSSDGLSYQDPRSF